MLMITAMIKINMENILTMTISMTILITMMTRMMMTMMMELAQYGRRAGGGLGHVPDGWTWWAGLVGNSR